MRRTIRAAGGVVYRYAGGEPEFLLARRPRYHDWTLPKGKLDPGEGPQEAALREVREETGFSCRTEAEVGTIGYQLGSGRPKAVRYWLMQAEAGEFTPNSEVDKIKWLSAASATKRLSYRKERQVLARATDMVAEPHSGRLYVIRHASAGTRTKAKSDTKRKLSQRGARQSAKIGRRLAKNPIVEIRSSRYIRCVQTVEPLGRSLGIPVEKDKRLTEGNSLEDFLELIAELSGSTAALCSHGDMIGLLIEHLKAEGVDLGGTDEFRKASIWTLDTIKGRVTAGSYQKPPS